MSKKKDKELEDLLKKLGVLIILVFVALWLTNRDKFYIYFSVAFVVLIIAVVIIIILRKHRFDSIGTWHSGKGLIKELQSMHPNIFEEYIADLYSRLGYSTELVGGSYDGGIDVIVTKNGIKHYIQCKKYISSKVGVSEVRDFYGAMAGKLSSGKGIFITTNIFTSEAEHFASDKPIELIDGDRLLSLIKKTKKDKEEINVNNDSQCPNCGGNLVEKSGKYGKFFGCSNYPECRFTRKIS